LRNAYVLDCSKAPEWLSGKRQGDRDRQRERERERERERKGEASEFSIRGAI